MQWSTRTPPPPPRLRPLLPAGPAVTHCLATAAVAYTLPDGSLQHLSHQLIALGLLQINMTITVVNRSQHVAYLVGEKGELG
ncbi:hypothetical protein E2C01_008609 [Portunus trituberculatus]|uniref:Uncharacterized protein n=1 Tax=Portunus trituberculatus TaxID=210409 RepID=A0A5B7D4X2_PORTR|nr:hypothetical protein [Portunus trituberculatus]